MSHRSPVERTACTRSAASLALAVASFASPALAVTSAYIESHIVASPTNPSALTNDFWVRNPGAPTNVTVVWKNAGQVVARQTMEVGPQPRWHSWVHRRRHGNENALPVDLVAAAGSVTHTDTCTPGAAASVTP